MSLLNPHGSAHSLIQLTNIYELTDVYELPAARVQASEAAISEGAGAALRRHYGTMLESALDADGHLFDESDRHVISALRAAAPPAQSLLLRLRQRKGPWFRVAALAYADVGDCDGAAAALAEAGLARLVAARGAPICLVFM